MLKIILKLLPLLFIIICKNNADVILPIISVELDPNGFHRDLNFVAHFDYPLAGKDNCEYYLEQKFPSAVYVDINQLDNLIRFQKMKVIYPNHINVELPTEKALPFSLVIWGTPKISDSISLPIHYRYHSPGNKNFVQVKIPPPNLYLKCSNEDLTTILITTRSKLEKNETKFCLKETEFFPKTKVSYDNELKDADKCDYVHLDYDLILKTSLIAKIPVGDLNLYQLVFYVTYIASWVGCLCVLSAIQHKMQFLKNKI